MTSRVAYTEEEEKINQMWESAKTPQEKELVTNKFIGIVKDNKENILLRAEAIRKLGEIGALDAQDIAKDISDTSVWVNKAVDIMRELIWEEDTQTFNYRKPGVTTEKLIEMVVEQEPDNNLKKDAKRKLENIGMKNLPLVHNSSRQNWVDMTYYFIDAANETYHRLRYLRETDPEKKYQLLLDTVKNSGGEAYGWAEEQLILNGEERALPDIIEVLKRAWGGSDEEYVERAIKTYKAKFAVVKAAKNDPTVYEKIVKGKYPFLYSDDEEIRDSVMWWVAKIGGFKRDEISIGTEDEDNDKKDDSDKDKEHKDRGKDDKPEQKPDKPDKKDK
jgi:hypothetical protein